MRNINEIPFEEIAHEYSTRGQELAKAKANLEYIKKNEKSVLAIEASVSGGTSEAERNRYAYSSENYGVWKEGYKVAIKEVAQLDHYLSALDMSFKYKQSINAKNRALAQIQ